MLKIEPSSKQERDRILRALAFEPSRMVSVRCPRGCRLARVAATPEGIAFCGEAWDAPRRLTVEATADGELLGRREMIRAGLSDNPIDKHATLAMLGRDAERVDLLVRCTHGAAILDPDEVVSWTTEKARQIVAVGRPIPDYEAPEPWGASTVSTTHTRKIGTAMPIGELTDWLAAHSD
ncbi:hypothetical protein [Brachybacterium huguangmaarense]